ncbi:hypothetical protein Are01nite_15470 [Actinoplanes regularis]|nr:hypothetical protein Are01nite_15470 [Actinoplanes regularis]
MATPATAAAAPAASTAPPTTKPANRLYSYDKTLVPLGASVKVELKSTGDSLWTRLDVSGLAPGHAYGAHVHIAECGADPKAAGPHFQHHPDPAATPTTPSADPAYANPTNEIWLDFTTDAKGAASVNNTHAWSFATNHWPRSLVLHAETTKTGPGVAGTAGARVGCLTLNDGH